MAEIIEDLETALEQAGLLETFNQLPPSHQREYIKWINEAKKPETRAKRIEKAVEMIQAKQK